MMTQSALFGNHSAMFDGINSPDAFALGDPKRSISSLLTSSKIIKPIKGGGSTTNYKAFGLNFI